MTDEIKENQNPGDGIDYIQMLEEHKKNTVSKEQYDKLLAEQKQLVEKLLNGETIQQESIEDAPNVEDLRKDLFSGECELTNLEYAKKALQLRQAILDNDGIDIFVAAGHKVAPTNEDYQQAQLVADVFQECIEAANGDSEAFTNELMRRTNDVSGIIRRR